MSDYGEDEEQDNNIDSALLSRADLLDAEYPNRPRNTSPTLKFRDLVCSLFEALVDLQHKPRTRKGGQYSAHEARRNAINRFIQRWRNEVGPDIYPAFRLIMPERDKDRPMYGLKEASLGKMLVAVRSRPRHSLISQTMGIGKDSEDALAITKWKLPGQVSPSALLFQTNNTLG
jgi:DNA ligase-4